MQLEQFDFQTIDWESIPIEQYAGEKGLAYWQVFMMNNIRIRKVIYSPGYQADHWCKKGHIILCTEGEMETTLENGHSVKLNKGMTYVVGDESEAHCSSTQTGCELFIVD
jgi:hypothetical protein